MSSQGKATVQTLTAGGDDLAEVIAAAAQVLGLHQTGEGVLAAEGGRVSRLQTEWTT